MAHAFSPEPDYLPRSLSRFLARLARLLGLPAGSAAIKPTAGRTSIKAVRPASILSPRSWRGASARLDAPVVVATPCCGCSGESCRKQKRETAAP